MKKENKLRKYTLKELFDILMEMELFRNDVGKEFAYRIRQIEYITDSERKILVWRFGHCKSRQEVGWKYGITRERVKQIEVRAIKKLNDKNLV